MNTEENKKKNKTRFFFFCVLIILALIIGDQVMRNWEFNQLLSKVETSENTINSYKKNLADASTVYWNGKDITQIDIVASKLAIDAKDDLELSKYAVESVFVLPWHFEIALAKKEYLLHNMAWIVSMDTTAIRNDNLVQSDTDISRINSTWKSCLIRLEEAIPLLKFGDLESRISDIEAG